MSVLPIVDDTIAALASAPGAGERGIIRVSGPQAEQIIAAVLTPADAACFSSARRPWRHPGTVNLSGVRMPLPVDVWFWPTNRSYTGQPVGELHTIGSPPLLDALLQELFAHGARAAQRGEFTLRAFLAGRLDLVQAEAVLGVIEATDQQQLRQALEQLGGGLSQRIAARHEELLLVLADLEAGLDFVDEDIAFITRDELISRLTEVREYLCGLLEQAASRLQVSVRRKVVLAGLPNAGKSTLFNALCGREAAIVTARAGTTRDYLSEPVEWRGISLELVDAAGWDEAPAGEQERAADALRQDQWRRADLIVWCRPADIHGDKAALDARLEEECRRGGQSVVHLTTKIDLAEGNASSSGLAVCAVTGAGIDELKSKIVACFQTTTAAEGEILGTTAARCRESLSAAADAVKRAIQSAASGGGDEVIAVELRDALEHLGRIVGRVYTDDILDRIFSRFCIGK